MLQNCFEELMVWTNRLAVGRGVKRTSNKNPSESKKLYVDLLYMS